MSDLDTLVDLGDSTTSAPKSMSDSANMMDEFDPFGPATSSMEEPNTNGNAKDNDNDNLLVDFTVETSETIKEKPKQNGITNNFDVDYEVTMSAENEVHSEGHIYANSEPMADPIYENVGDTNGKAEDDVYENVVKETGDNQEISVTIKADINTLDGNLMYDTPKSHDDDDIVVISSEDDGTPAPRFDTSQNDEGEIEIEIAPKSPTRSRSNSENQGSVSPAERPASPTPDHGLSDDDGQNQGQSPVPTPTPRKRTSLSRSKSPELEITKSGSRSPSVSSEGRNTRSPSPDDMMINQEEEIIKNGETISKTREDAVFTGKDGCSTETIETSKVTHEEISTDQIHSPIAGDEHDHGGRILASKSEAGVFENEPTVLDGVVRHADASEEDKLYEHGTAKNLAAGFKEIQDETAKPALSQKREITPDRFHEKAEFVSEPRSSIVTYEGKADTGIYESQPQELSEDVISGYAKPQDQLPQKGTTDNIKQKFKEITSTPTQSSNRKREITPDRTGKSEFVSEPRATFEEFVGKPESGIFESQPVRDPNVIRPEDDMDEEILPNQGTARNLVMKFKKLQEEQPYVPKKPVDILPLNKNLEPAICESQPISLEGVYKEGDETPEKLPEKGQTRNLLAKFREIENGGGSQSPSPRGRKEFTPPREHPMGYVSTGNRDSGVYENTPKKGMEFEQPKIEGGIYENQPVSRPDVVKEADRFEEGLPEHGTARSLLSKFKQIQSDASVKSPTTPSPRSFKEFTPPREDVPTNKTAVNEDGIVENDPQFRPDVLREADTDWNEGLPSKGSAKSVVDKFKNIQEEAKKDSAKAMLKKPSKVRR